MSKCCLNVLREDYFVRSFVPVRLFSWCLFSDLRSVSTTGTILIIPSSKHRNERHSRKIHRSSFSSLVHRIWARPKSRRHRSLSPPRTDVFQSRKKWNVSVARWAVWPTVEMRSSVGDSLKVKVPVGSNVSNSTAFGTCPWNLLPVVFCTKEAFPNRTPQQVIERDRSNAVYNKIDRASCGTGFCAATFCNWNVKVSASQPGIYVPWTG